MGGLLTGETKLHFISDGRPSKNVSTNPASCSKKQTPVGLIVKNRGLVVLKKLVICSAIFASFQAHACNVSYSTSSNVISNALSTNGFDFANYDVVCEKLNRANAALEITGQATVLHGKSIAWASVSLKDRNTSVFTDEFAGSNTVANPEPSMDTANNLVNQAINGAIERLGIDQAIQSLNENRRKAKAAYSRG
ncbi:hypothetical protein [Paraburkholderia sp. HD33-4]|uniref:hypothetical protein n=1 Tax=Paraburkholderia sp. HD33-4 TaxID=2883242 RepID=UPI001F47FD4F|nr:hypothetical protein [Paraburkholderia sp. HD33-4]